MQQLKDKLDELTNLLTQATEQVNMWTVKRLKLEGAIEVVKTLLAEEPKPKEKT